jgi:hypothetical protein
VQLVVRHAVDVEAARALEGQLVAGEHAVEQLGAARSATAAVDDPLDLAGEAVEPVLEARVLGVGDDGRVVRGEDLGVAGGRRRSGDREQGEGDDEGSEHRVLSGRIRRRRACRRAARGRGRAGS